MRAKKYIVASFLFCFILFGITVCASAKVKTNGEYESARGSNREYPKVCVNLQTDVR